MTTTLQPILVTGASGFVGEHLVRLLVAHGHDVVGAFYQRPLAIAGVQMDCIDLSDRSATKEWIARIRPRAIAHLAAQTNVAICEQDPEGARQAIVEATRNIVQAVREEIPETPIVALSTDLVFDGEKANYSPVDLPKPLSTYGKLKLAAEPLVLDYVQGVVMRSALIYGAPVTHASSFLGWMRDTLTAGKELILFEDEYRTPILVDDLCVAIERMLVNPLPGLWHAGGPQRLSRLEMGQQVAEVFGLSQRLLAPRRLADSTYAAPRPRETSLDSSQLWSTLAYTPSSFRKGIEKIREKIGQNG